MQDQASVAQTTGPAADKPPHYSNFNTLRLIAASSVIFSHAFLIADGNEESEPFKQFCGQILGIYGVLVFMIISGYLVTQSLHKSSSLREFAWKRVLRIYPALAGCALVSALVIAPFYSDIGAKAYLMTANGIKYAIKVLLLWDVYEIRTVAFHAMETQNLGQSVNGSLWSITAEIHCYIILLLAAALDLVLLPVVLGGLVLFSGLLAISANGGYVVSDPAINLFYVMPSFCAGAAVYLLDRRYGLRTRYAILSLIGLALVLLFYRKGLLVAFPFLATYPLVMLGKSQRINLGNGARFGDLSYGAYLYGWIMTQIVRSLSGENATGYSLTLWALPMALACGFLSWHLIEKHALGFKHLAPSGQRRKPASPACAGASATE